eukprot:GFYU01039247.1.p1 GENE.GFYU01039247.1~~GFYU01039247.1.p1  ORF type:complete len:198 (-),score=25.55 GFYU01039247.1:26-619(-)
MSAPEQTMSRAGVEALTEDHFQGARILQNQFLGARKAFCFICPYKCCPFGESEFAKPYRSDATKLQTTGVYVDDGKVIGFAQMTHYPQSQDPCSKCLHKVVPGESYIEMMSVAPEARGKGVGTKLLQWCEDTARERGAEFLSLGVVSGNPAKRLYVRFGFEDVKQSPCSACCACISITTFMGCPHCRLGGSVMRKTL